jgi:hypothetical protein
MISSIINFGNSINDKYIKEQKQKEFIDNGKKINKSNYRPSYSTNEVPKFEENLWIMTEKRFDESLKNNTFIINDIYNNMNKKRKDIKNNKKLKKQSNSNDSDSEFSDDETSIDSTHSNKYSDRVVKKNQLEFFNNVENFNNKNIKNNDNNNDENLINYQFQSLRYNNPSNPVSNGRIAQNINNKSLNAQKAKQYEDLGYSSLKKSLTYNVIPENMLTHNNMVPYFKHKDNIGYDPSNYEHMSNQFQRKLDSFSGSLNNIEYKPKTERRPLFNPLVGLTNVYGSPVKTDDFEGRFIPSRERKGEKLFQEVKVTPGLNLPYNEVGQSGFHDPYRALPKTVNELRTKNNPKLSYINPMVSDGINKFKGGMQPVKPNVYKRHPDRFEEWGTDRMLPSDSYISAPKIEGYYDPKNMATDVRGLKSTNLTGPLGYNVSKGVVNGNVSSSKETFKHAGPSNLGSSERNKNYTYNVLGMTPDPTQRNTYNQQEVGGMGNSQYNKTYAHDKFNATPDPTQRNTYNQQEVGGMGNSQYNKTYAHDKFNATPDPTQRNTYNQQEVGGMGNSQYNKTYAYDKINATPDPTQRNTYNQQEVGGMGNSQYNKTYAYDKINATPDPTQRNTYNQQEVGGMGNSQYNKTYVYDKINATPDPTQRNTYNQQEVGGMGNSQYNKTYTYDKFNMTPDPTQRNTYNQQDVGGMGNSQYNKIYTYDKFNMTPDPTLRNMHNYNDPRNIGNSQFNKTYIYNKSLLTPDPTLRNIHNVKDSTGILGSHPKQMSRMDAENSYTNNVKDENTIIKRTPTLSSYEKTPTIENTMVSLCDKIQVNRDLFPDITQQLTPGLKQPSTLAKQKVPNDEYRFNSFVRDNYQGNKYINDSQNIAIYPPNYFNRKRPSASDEDELTNNKYNYVNN